MLIEGKEYLEDAANHLKKLTEEEKIQMQCEMREKYRRDMSSIRKEGRREGRQEGRREGRQEGLNQRAVLIQLLNADGRAEEILKAAQDAAYRDKLLLEYGL